MRIGVNTRLLLSNKLEGIGWFSYETLKRITRNNLDDEFFFFFDRPYDPEFIFSPNVTPVVLFPQARHPFLWWWFFEISLKRSMKKHKIDVFLSPDSFVSLKSDVPTIDVIHDIAFEHHPEFIESSSQRKYLLNYTKKFALKSDHIATVSEYTKQDIIQTYGIEADKISVVYNGANTNYKALSELEKQAVREAYTEGQPYFIYIGSLHRRKNICNLLKGFDIYKQNSQDNVKLLVIGSAMWCRDEYGGVLDKMQYKKDVINIKRLEPIELSKVLAASIALTYVSLFEGFGIPIVEAFYAETAVITSNVTSMPEVADDAALFCNPEDPKDIAEKMLDLARTPGLRHDLIEKGKIQRQKFNWDTTAEKLWQIIDSFRNKQTNDR